jgi:CHRD domain-containing protein
MLKALVLLAGAALAVAGLSLAAPQQDTYALTASLRARAEVPEPSGVPSGAVGLFTGKAVELESDRARLTWRLTFRKLSGRAIAAHVHAGRPGKAGNVLVPLCGPCRSGQRGRATITHAQLRAIRRGLTYVNVHTARNAAGEVRGQLKASKTGSSDDPPADPSPSPEPPPTTPYP